MVATAVIGLTRDHSILTARLSSHKGMQLKNNLAVISTAEVLRVAHAFSYRSGESLEQSICGSELATQKAFEFARKRLA